MEPVAVFIVADANQLRQVSVGYVVRTLDILPVVVLHHHQAVSPAQFFFPVQHLGADAGVVPHRPLVGAAEHRHFIRTIFIIGIRKRLQELPAPDAPEIRKTFPAKGQVRKANGFFHRI